MMLRCDECRFWSDKLAMARGNGVEAYCLSGDGPHAGEYTPAFHGCLKWRDASLGAVDSGSDSDPRYGNPYMDDESLL